MGNPKGLRVDRGRTPQLLGAAVKIGRFKEGHQAQGKASARDSR